MFLVHLVAGLLGLAALAAAVVLGMRGAERLVARLLGVPAFRWFEVGAAPSWWWKRSLVRLSSALAPYAICAGLFFVVYAVGGAPEPTTKVTVLAQGAAHDAGLQDGDTVLALGGVSVNTWDELRLQIQAHSEPVLVVLERAGQRQELSVTPRAGRLGVAPTMVTRSVGLGQAVSLGTQLPLKVVKEAAKAFIAWHQVDETELKGPIGIVKESGTAAGKGSLEWLFFLALLGSYLWPFVAAVHVFDAVTGWTFRMTFTEMGLAEPVVHIARLRFSMSFALGCWLAAVLAEGAARANLPGALLLLGLLAPGFWALLPLLWVSSRELGDNRALMGARLPVSFVPCAAPILGVWVALRLRAEERRLRSHVQPGSGEHAEERA